MSNHLPGFHWKGLPPPFQMEHENETQPSIRHKFTNVAILTLWRTSSHICITARESKYDSHLFELSDGGGEQDVSTVQLQSVALEVNN